MTKIRLGLVLATALTAVAAWVLPAAAQTGKAQATAVAVTAGKPSEFHFTLSKKSAAKGAATFKIVNKGKLAHDFKIAGKTSKMVQPGKSTTLKVTLKKGKQKYECTVPGHAAAGMKGVLLVK